MEWFLIPICSVLWRLGGSKNKGWRRFGIPVVLVSVMMLKSFVWWYIFVGLIYVGVFRLPFTLVGENKTYTIVTQKDGLWISLDADQRTWV